LIAISQVTTDDTTKAWTRYVEQHPLASAYHSLEWRRVVEESFGHRAFYLMATDEYNQTRGVLPLIFVSSRLFGHFLVSMPFFNYGGLLSDTIEARDSLLEAALGLGRNVGASHIELRHEARLELSWPCRNHKVSMRLDLPRDFETLWSRLPSKVRSQIRRAQKEHMEVRIGGRDILDDFHHVFVRNMRDLGTPVYARRFFDIILRTFPAESRIVAVYFHGRPVAAGFVYGFRDTLEIPWASSDRRYNRLAPNMLLYSSVLEFACRERFQRFDFGRCTVGSGTHRFKEQWGARPVPLHWYYWSTSGRPMSEASREHSMYGAAVKMWARLPLWATTVLGGPIVKNIP